MTGYRLAFSLALALGLAACGDEPRQAPANDRRNAEGDVLGGTISDAMLPLDTVTSQSPPLRETPSPGAGGEAGEDAAPLDAAEAPAAAPSPEPASEPTPEDGA